MRELLLFVIAACGWAGAVQAQEQAAHSLQSAYREGIKVEYLYQEDLEGVYWTTWMVREEKRDGLWRDIYFETAEKHVANGILSFQCFADDVNGNPAIGIVDWQLLDNPAQTDQKLTVILFEDRLDWQTGLLQVRQGILPPYELFVLAHYRFCGDPRNLSGATES